MQFLKKNYEKILLGIALLTLAVAAAWLPLEISKERESLEGQITKSPPPKPVKAVDLSNAKRALARLAGNERVEISGEHNLFNPIEWQMRGGKMVKMTPGSYGPKALKVLKITPLNFMLGYNASRNEPGGYWLQLTNEPTSYHTEFFAKVGERNTVNPARGGISGFTLQSIQGAADSPTGFVVELMPDHQTVTVGRDKAYSRVESHSADLRYDPENKTMPDVRMIGPKNTITFGGESYKVIAITENEVTVAANSNGKQTTIKVSP